MRILFSVVSGIVAIAVTILLIRFIRYLKEQLVEVRQTISLEEDYWNRFEQIALKNDSQECQPYFVDRCKHSLELLRGYEFQLLGYYVFEVVLLMFLAVLGSMKIDEVNQLVFERSRIDQSELFVFFNLSMIGIGFLFLALNLWLGFSLQNTYFRISLLRKNASNAFSDWLESYLRTSSTEDAKIRSDT